ncbi:branched-chain amino acid ABC transporter permease [Alkalihalobacterium alkalinitrilicum]|uniref:branched-chain amino acid ABC transporter permease n=1 Tax=Alkalihalobacterium alkalinitrilicum TaxID=427920 RepID=UPI000995D51C|nr:branched-chain amino acid ABC transporter permease [Alkalihalobacterium alkalinitrilicum]
MKNPFVMECGNYKTSYSKDMDLFRTPQVKLRMLIIVILLFLFPLVASNYVVGLATLCAIAVIGAIGLNILTGFTGQISVGVGAFLAVGGYTSAILTMTLGWSFWISLPLAGLVTAVIGGLFGIPSLRLKGLYLAIATLAAQVVILWIIGRWSSLTGGGAGMVLNRPSIGGYTFSSHNSYYFLCLTIAVLTTIYALNLFRTRTGRAFLAVRDRDVAAQIMGINLFSYKVMSFAISSFIVGIAGALLAHYTMVVTVELYSIQVSIQYLAMILVGGLGSVFGAILGAIFITLLPVGLGYMVEFLTIYLPNAYHLLSSFREFVFGLVIILFLIFEPGGLVHIWNNIKSYFRLWPFSY